ncbi:MAG: GNAT family N-acetyltransferase [Planctomycetota bacterium]|jgi:RimJ/RimL family protein N-acetyltransferase
MDWPGELTLERDGVTLEPLRLEHQPELQSILADGALADLWFTLVPQPQTLSAYLEEALAMEDAGTARPFLIRLQGEAVGSTRFCNIDAANRRAEIGYTWLIKSAQRTKVNSLCKLLLLGFLFEQHEAIAVEFRTHFHNRSSRRAIERLGAKLDGVLRQHRILPNGTFRDTVVYSILDSEWPAVKEGLVAAVR